MSLWIDNRPLTALGLRPSKVTGWLSGARGERAVAGIPGSTAPIVGALQAAPARVATVTAYVPLTTLTDRAATIAAVEAALANGIRMIRTADRPGVQTRAILQSCTWSDVGGASMAIPSLLCEMTWLAIDGNSAAWPTPGPVLLGTTPTRLTLGTLPLGGWLLAWGFTSPLVLTYSNASGTTKTTLTITQTLATGGHVALELDTADVWNVAADLTRTRITTVTGTVPACDPVDAVGGLGPTLTLSTGTGLLLPALRFRL